MFDGFDIPREQLESAREAHEDQLNKCARGNHPQDHVKWVWDYYGNPDVPGGTVTFKTYSCHFCGQEWSN
jgi:hypothetical protein